VSTPKIIILGAGAIGSLLGAMLSQNNNIILVGRKTHVEAINRQGLKVSGALTGIFPVKAVSELENVPPKSLIIITTKACGLEETILSTRDMYHTDTSILIIQNGYGNEDIVKSLTDAETIRGLVSTGVEYIEPGCIDVKYMGEIVLPDTQPCGIIKEIFNASGISVRVSENMELDIWRKVIMNCVINPLTTILGVPNNEIAVNSLKQLRDGIVGECVQVAAKKDVFIDPQIADEITEAAVKYSNRSSMYQDILKGNKTEIDFLNGMISEMGREHDIPTPINDTITALIRFMEEK